MCQKICNSHLVLILALLFLLPSENEERSTHTNFKAMKGKSDPNLQTTVSSSESSNAVIKGTPLEASIEMEPEASDTLTETTFETSPETSSEISLQISFKKFPSEILPETSMKSLSDSLVIKGTKLNSKNPFKYVKLAQKPFQVAIQSQFEYKKQFCSGSVLSEYFILTATYCLIFKKETPQKTTLQIGDVNLKGTQMKSYAHRSCYFQNVSAVYFEVALIRTEEPINLLTQYIRPISLPEKSTSFVPVGMTCEISGWGLDDSSKINNHLRYAEVQIVKQETCKNHYDFELPEDYICITGNDLQLCQFDYGSPLICNEYLTGLLSNIYERCESKAPLVMVNVGPTVGWIQNSMFSGKSTDSDRGQTTSKSPKVNTKSGGDKADPLADEYYFEENYDCSTKLLGSKDFFKYLSLVISWLIFIL